MKTAYISGFILDGTADMQPRRGTVLVENGRIAELLSPDALLPADCGIRDLQGGFLMPGLINMHVHLNSGGKPSAKKKEPEDYVRLVKLATSNPVTAHLVRTIIRGFAESQLRSGVTTIRTVGGILDYDGKVRDEMDAGYAKRAEQRKQGGSARSGRVNPLRAVRTGMTRIPLGTMAPSGLGAALSGGAASASAPGPRILTSNAGISVPGGHVAGSLAYPVTSPEEAVQYVQKIADSHPNLIKLMITGGIMDAEKEGEPGVLKMDPAIIRAACEEAHRLGLPVAAHVESTEGVVEALRGGVDTIEHGAMPTDEMMDLFQERKSCLITTISPVLPLALLDIHKTHVRPMDRYNAGIVLRGIIACARRALKEGVPVGLGTDAGCPFVTQYDMWRELAYFHNFCGVSNAYALHTATLGNAKIAGIDQETGSIEAGKSADFLVTAGNPLDDLRALRKPQMVVIRGEEVPEPGNRKDGEIERTLDELLKVSYEDLDRLIGKEIREDNKNDSKGGLAE